MCRTHGTDYRKERFPGHRMLFTGIKEQCEGLSPPQSKGFTVLKTQIFPVQYWKVKLFVYNSILFFLNFGKSFEGVATREE